MNKKANIVYQVVLQLILIGLIFGLFYLGTMAKANSRVVKQQILERDIALLVDSASPGMNFYVNKLNINGYITKISIKNSSVFVYPDGYSLSKGYPFFTSNSVFISEDRDKFIISVR